MPRIHLGTIAHTLANSFESDRALEIIEAGALLVDDEGKIRALGEKQAILSPAFEGAVEDHGGAWLLPGLVDGHSHFPQYYAAAAPGGQLLDWLAHSIFPAEMKFAEEGFAARAAVQFTHHLLACGTTTAMVFGSQFLKATGALFEAAQNSGLRLIAGMTLMDGNGPLSLLKSAEQAFGESEALIRRYHRPSSRLYYAITPRFALACTPALQEACADLLKAYPDCYLQTHINENRREIEAVTTAFPKARHYLDIYEKAHWLTPKTVLAHNIHARQAEFERLSQIGCAVCHCPSSNLYLGSGLFPLQSHLKYRIPMAIGTDIGAGTHFSVWQELSDAYKIQQLQGFHLNAAQLLYLGTLGGAKALHLEQTTGNFAAGKSADFFVLSIEQDDYLKERLDHCEGLTDQLFALLHLAGPQHIKATYSAGKKVWPCSSSDYSAHFL